MGDFDEFGFWLVTVVDVFAADFMTIMMKINL